MNATHADPGCRECSARPADRWLNEDGPLCDGHFDARIAAASGWPRLPAAPPPIEIIGPDQRRHVLRYRVWRSPGGVSVELHEDGVPVGEGFVVRVVGEHDADVAHLAAQVRRQAQAEIGRLYLEPDPHGTGWQLAGNEIAGRLEFDPDDGMVRVVIDGRVLSWEELGQALASFEGWQFRMSIES